MANLEPGRRQDQPQVVALGVIASPLADVNPGRTVKRGACGAVEPVCCAHNGLLMMGGLRPITAEGLP
jgi:hypothetical protein